MFLFYWFRQYFYKQSLSADPSMLHSHKYRYTAHKFRYDKLSFYCECFHKYHKCNPKSELMEVFPGLPDSDYRRYILQRLCWSAVLFFRHTCDSICLFNYVIYATPISSYLRKYSIGVMYFNVEWRRFRL